MSRRVLRLFARAIAVSVESAHDLNFHYQKCDVSVGAVYQPCIMSHTSTGGTKQANAWAAEGNSTYFELWSTVIVYQRST